MIPFFNSHKNKLFVVNFLLFIIYFLFQTGKWAPVSFVFTPAVQTFDNIKLKTSFFPKFEESVSGEFLQFIRIDFVVHKIHAQYYRSWRLTVKLKDVHSANDGLASIIKVEVKLTPGTIGVVRCSLPAANGFWNFCRSPTLATSVRTKGESWSKLSSLSSLSSQSWAHDLKCLQAPMTFFYFMTGLIPTALLSPLYCRGRRKISKAATKKAVK